MPRTQKKTQTGGVEALCQDFGLVLTPTATGEDLVGQCPFCDKPEKFTIHRNTGKGSCFSCGVKWGHPYYLALKLLDTKAQAVRALIDVGIFDDRNNGHAPDPIKRMEQSKMCPKGSLAKVGAIARGPNVDIPMYDSEFRQCSTFSQNGSGKGTNAKGKPVGLFCEHTRGKPKRPKPGSTVFKVEGPKELAAMVDFLRRTKRKGIAYGLPGCKLPKEFLSVIKDTNVVSILDRDKAGERGAEEIAALCRGHARSVTNIVLPLPFKDTSGPGIRDLLIQGGLGDRLLENELKHTKPIWKKKAGGKKVPATKSKSKQKKPISLDQCRKVFCKWLVLPDPEVVDIVLGAVAGNRLAGDPLWIQLVGPAGDGKTELLQSVVRHPDIFALSNLSPRSLISGYVTDDGSDPSVLPDLDGKILLNKDFTAVLGMPNEARKEIFATLRDIYDGSASKSFGGGQKVRRHESSFNILCACTPAVEKYTDFTQELGERFLRIRLPEGKQKEKIKRSLGNEKSKDKMREELSDAALSFLDGVSHRRPTIPDKILKATIDLADFTARARTTVSRDRFTKEIEFIPVVETGTRVGNQLARLGLSVAMVRSRRALTWAEYGLMKRASLDTIPSRRRVLVEALLNSYADGYVTIDKIRESVRLPKSNVARGLQELHLLELIDEKVTVEGRAKTLHYRLSTSTYKTLTHDK